MEVFISCVTNKVITILYSVSKEFVDTLQNDLLMIH